MKEFRLQPKILFGEDSLDYLKTLEYKKVMIVTDEVMTQLKLTADNILLDEYNYDIPFTQKEGKSETINKFIRPKYNGRGPILVAGDAVGDESMLTEFKDTEVLLIMKREGKLDNLVNDERALIQYRNLKTGLLDPK